ncbi:MAG: EamA family transporter [Oscillospiraceae bacterium]|jgi:drug/metabolite transporter (DMT)-like permease|nr:EamA family transporter [Oscillospiraceae bacterium]
MIYILLFIICVLVSSFAQILLKKAASRDYTGLRAYLNREVIIGYSIFLLVTLGTVTLYRFVPLSTGALLEAAAYVFIPVLSYLLLGEKVSRRNLIGIGLIIAGIAVYAVWGSAV